MRQGVLLVAEPLPSPNPERRSASIAAALAAATPAPEVTSLAAARHERDAKQKRSAPKRGWIAGVAAAAAAFLVAIPIAISLGGSPNAETTATNVVEEAPAETTADVSASDATDAMEDEAVATEDSGSNDGDAEQESFVDNRDEVAEAIEDDAANDPRANRVNTSDLETANTVGAIAELISNSTLAPRYDTSAVIEAGVNESCVRSREGVTSDLAFDLVNLDSFGGAARLVLIEFADDGTTRVLDAEDCASLR